MDPEEIGSIAWHTREEIATVLKGKGEDGSKTEMEGGESQQGSKDETEEGSRKDLKDITADLPSLSEQCVLNGECMSPHVPVDLFSDDGEKSIHSGCLSIEAKSNRRASQSWSIPRSLVLNESHSKDGHDGEDGVSEIETVK
jgi:hypothetical protein